MSMWWQSKSMMQWVGWVVGVMKAWSNGPGWWGGPRPPSGGELCMLLVSCDFLFVVELMKHTLSC